MSIGNTSLHQSGEIPEIVKLPNGRIRVTRRFHKFTREDVDNANLGSLMGDFGDLDTAGEQISNQGYTNCRLISVEVDTRFNSVSNTDSAVLVKTYETLTDLFVQITDDTVTFTENGLKQITRVYRAVSGTPSSTVVGVTALGTGEILASSRIEDNDAFAELTETYVEAGILSRTEDFVGSQDSLVIEAIGPDPSTPLGFSLASKQESNYEGLQTNRFTFLKPSVLSVQQDFNNGLKRVSVQAFNLDSAAVSAALSEVTVDHKLIATNESDYEGIKTTTFQYQIDETFTEDYELNGLKRISLIELSTTNFTAIPIGSQGAINTPQFGLYLATQDIDEGGIIKVRESTWLEAGTLNVQRRSESEGVYRVTTTFLGVEGSVVGPIVARVEDNYEGLKTITVVSMQDASGASLVEADSQPVASHSTLSEFSYPGVVTISSQTLTGSGSTFSFLARDFSLKPPVVSKVPATIKVSFKTSSAISYTSSGGLWNPTTWAEGSSKGIAWNYLPFSISRGFRGYRIDRSIGVVNSYSAFGSGSSNKDMISGKRIFANTTYSIKVDGGPPNPVGGQYTLDYSVSLAFEDVYGVAYYKHTEIVSTIPAQ